MSWHLLVCSGSIATNVQGYDYKKNKSVGKWLAKQNLINKLKLEIKMKTFKGTQGKWRIEKKYRKFETVIKCGKIRVAESKHYNTGDDDWSKNDPMFEEGYANAKLIAVAPEMLALLQKFVDEHMLSNGNNLAKNLINRALRA